MVRFLYPERSTLHTFGSAARHWLILLVMSILSYFCFKSFEKETKNAPKVQEQVLLKLLRDNQATTYGQYWKFNEITTREEFQVKHPLTTYSHYKQYIEDVEANGDTKSLSDYPVVKLALSSGTSGSRKALLFTKKQKTVFFVKGIAVIYYQLLRIAGKSLQKTCKFMYNPTKRTSRSNIPMGPNSSSPEDSKSMMCMFTTPPAGYLEIKSERSALYVHLLFALKDENLGQFEANFISIIFHAFEFLLNHWSELVDDIRNGTVNPAFEMNDVTRKTLIAALKGKDKKRADFLQQEFDIGTKNIAIRIWPKLKCILSVSTGPFQLYDEKLLEWIPASVPRYSPLYAATEGLLGVNLKENSDEYILVPGAMFFEFIPVGEGEYEEYPLFMDQVEIGKQYELVITNMSGLYRYRMGDVIKIVGHYNAAVMIQFQYRKGQLINARGEKTSEKMFSEAIQQVEWPSAIMEFTCLDPACVESSGFPQYSVFVELQEEVIPENMEQLVGTFDGALCNVNPIYQSFREKGGIGCPIVQLVRAGTFDKIRQEMINSGTGINQVKIPRVTRYTQHIDILHSSVLHK